MSKISQEVEARLKQACNSHIQTFQIRPDSDNFQEFKARLGHAYFQESDSGVPFVQISGPASMVESDMDCRYNWYTITTWSSDNLTARYSFPLVLSWPRYVSSDEILLPSKTKPGHFRFNFENTEVKYASRKLDQEPRGYKSSLVFDAEEQLLARSKSVLLSIFPEAAKQEVDLSKLLS